MDEGGIILHKSSMGGKFFTSSDLIPFYLRDFLASLIFSSSIYYIIKVEDN
jgi:hypothetical protein